MIETRVGFVSTSILEGMVRDYIFVNVVGGLYVGELKYLFIIKNLMEYNKK